MRCWLVVLCAASASCGYALTGRVNALPSYIRTIGVPPIANQSTTGSIDQVFTEAVRAEFLSRGRYVVRPDATGVDAILTGAITNVRVQSANLDVNSQATTNTIIVSASVEFKDVRENKVLWANQAFVLTEVYPVSSATVANDPAALFRQDTPALERLSKRFAKEIVTAVFEAF